MRLFLCLALLVAAMALPEGAAAASSCPISSGATDDAKPNKLYLYYPAVADPTFPEFGVPGADSSPADPFDVSLLTSYSGTEAQLRNAVNDVVTDDYCEFNVQVRPTTTAPPATFARRAVVAIGTDDNTTGRWGRTDVVDIGDPTALGFSRVWAGHFQATSGGPGLPLNGVNSTVQRWGYAIGGTAAHEAGHTYGLTHADGSDVQPGEGPVDTHIMPAGSEVGDEARACCRRIFGNTEFSVLAANVGLSIQTMHNWDMVNPNSTAGHKFRLTFLSPQSSPALSWSYSGAPSPWVNPTVSPSLGTQVFKGTTYKRFRITWSTGHAWNGGSPGQVPAGGEFHVGATFSGVDFNQPDPIIITDSELLDADGDPLPLKPRLPGYDAGKTALDDGVMEIAFTNFGDDRMRLENVVVRELPRVLSLDAMVAGGGFFDPFGQSFRPWPGRSVALKESRPFRGKRSSVSVRVGRMRDERHILEEVSDKNCDAEDSLAEPDSARCKPGFEADLFPATTLFVTADAVTPHAKVWNPRRKRFVRRSLVSRIYFQVGGRTPDFNHNGIDDAIDIEFRHVRDRNKDGVPDRAQR
jgi:hypothetical protein